MVPLFPLFSGAVPCCAFTEIAKIAKTIDRLDPYLSMVEGIDEDVDTWEDISFGT
jgi:hypothetical protein